MTATRKNILFSEFADSEVKALMYGDYYDQILSTRENNIEYVTSRLIFKDKTKSEIRKSTLKP